MVGTASKSKVRLAVIAFTGFTQRELKQLKPRDILWDRSAVMAPAWHKGPGSSAQLLPVTQRGMQALKEFADLDCWAAFLTASLNRTFRRAYKRSVSQTGARMTFGIRLAVRCVDRLTTSSLSNN